ncbi:hypothetical protein B296_00025332 [Ensete ventricosum]|uniref:Uncharacterized protein n=1 Tax=Ensete ventricosum TaxID=4639 RepID=A0A426XRA2_ENSVE|nr:hypothetical protein B296_00025332 [Ensete ventricosum]
MTRWSRRHESVRGQPQHMTEEPPDPRRQQRVTVHTDISSAVFWTVSGAAMAFRAPATDDASPTSTRSSHLPNHSADVVANSAMIGGVCWLPTAGTRVIADVSPDPPDRGPHVAPSGSGEGQEAKGARRGIPFRLRELGAGGGGAGSRASCLVPSRDPPPDLPLPPDLLSSAAVDDESLMRPPPSLGSSSPGFRTKVASLFRFTPAN